MASTNDNVVTPLNPLIGATEEETFRNVLYITQLMEHLLTERTAWKKFIEGTGPRMVHAPKPLPPDEERGLTLLHDLLTITTNAAAAGMKKH